MSSADAEALRRCRIDCEALQQELARTREVLAMARRALAESRANERVALRGAARDTLTGMPNRRAFEHRTRLTLQQHAGMERPFCLMFIDLDGFKSVNDRLGHQVGDALLKVVGARLMQALRGDDFVSRHGGDEFLCLLPSVQQAEQALHIGGKLIDVLAAPCRIGTVMLQVRASVGIALYPQDGVTIESLVDSADRAMLWAKSRGVSLALAGRTRESLPQRPRPHLLAERRAAEALG